MAKKLTAFTLFALTVTVHYFTPERAVRVPASETTIGTAGQTVGSNADLTIIVDRNPKVQQMKVYGSNGAVLHTFPVSTGRFAFEFPPFGKPPGCTDTPLSDEGGAFSPILTKELHRSGRWQHDMRDANGNPMLDPDGVPMMEGSAMKYSTFITPAVAMHVAPPGTEGQIGTPASGGCIRMNEVDAKTIFDSIVKKTATGEYDRIDPTNSKACMPTAANAATFKAANYCADKTQWEVRRQPLNVKVIVKDSSPIEEQRCKQMQCSVKMAQFNFDKKVCVREKLKASTASAMALTQPADFNPKAIMDSLPEKERKAIDEGCNSELKAKHEANPKPVSCTAPIPRPRPAGLGGAAATAPIVNQPAPQEQLPPAVIQEEQQVDQAPVDNTNLDGLYMDFGNRN